MALTVNKSQQVVTGGLNPRSAYSRIIVAACEAAGGGVRAFGYTASFGQQVKLLGIKVVANIQSGGAVERMEFNLYRGQSVPVNVADVLNWEKLILIPQVETMLGMPVMGNHREYEWNFVRLFSGELNRFAVVLLNDSTNVGNIYVFFHIAEG